MAAKGKLSRSAEEIRLKSCVRCGYGPEHHELGNYADGPMIGRQFLVCPTATYKSLGDTKADRK